ncbi:hypothetical protein EV2_011920 [Malus domestica]
MGSTSAIFLCSHPKILLRPQRLQSQFESQGPGSARLGYRAQGVFLPPILPRRRRCLAVKAASRPSGARRVYRESQSGSSLSVAPVKQLASFVVPVASFFAVTFGTAFAFNSFFYCLFSKKIDLVECWIEIRKL